MPFYDASRSCALRDKNVPSQTSQRSLVQATFTGMPPSQPPLPHYSLNSVFGQEIDTTVAESGVLENQKYKKQLEPLHHSTVTTAKSGYVPKGVLKCSAITCARF